MATAPSSNTQTTSANLKAFEDQIKAQVADAKSKLDQFEAKARDKGSAAEASAIAALKTSREDIDRRLQDLKATHDAHIARAKSEIDADVAKFKASIDALGATLKTTK